MKRKIYLLLLCILPASMLLAQQTPFQWTITSKKNADSYTLTINAGIAKGWHIYAETAPADGLEEVLISWENENVTKTGKPGITPAAVSFTDPVFDNKKINVYRDTFTFEQQINISGNIPASLKVTLKAQASNNEEFIIIEDSKNVPLEGGKETASASKIKLTSVDLKAPVIPCGEENSAGKGLFTIFLLGLGGGFIALLTPCVFPMIPVTVSFFTKRSANRGVAVRNGLLYGFFIFLIYIAASVPFHIAGVQPEIFNNISTNAWLNVFFFIVFIIFAISFFGYFEITLPSGIAGKVDSKGGLSSISGIFFMALTLVIVSFSCTGVILGTLLVGTASDGAWSLTAGMAGFGTALGFPFALFAIFPNWLKSLPKSGGWLDTVKKVLAFVELALAFKFLSNADLVEHWGILKREVFIAIWIIITLGLALYLLGWLRLPHDEKGQKISTGRKAFGIASFLFALYLVPGLTNTSYANLKWLSGFPPPLSYSIYSNNKLHEKGLEPHVINDYEKAVQLSQQQNKPILIDFTGWACVNCRKMEEQVWTQPEISTLIKEQYILVSLYVDDRKKLLPADRFIYQFADGKQKEIETVGDKWETFQTENFAQAAQPLYVVLNSHGELLTNPVGYTPNVTKYREWLECGLKAYQTK